MWGQLGIGRIQSGHDIGLVGDVQRSVLVRYVANRRLIGRDDERAVDEHGVGQVLGDRHTQRVEILNVTYPRLHGNGHVAYLRIQSDVFDLTDAPEQRLHLILGGLRCDVRHLYHLRGGHGGRVGAGRHREIRADDGHGGDALYATATCSGHGQRVLFVRLSAFAAVIGDRI